MSVIAGNPPADFAQASGRNGMIEMVEMNAKQAPRAPRTPNFLFQNPENKSTQNSHSEVPRNRPGASNAENGVKPENKWSVADKRDQALSLIVKPFRISKK